MKQVSIFLAVIFATLSLSAASFKTEKIPKGFELPVGLSVKTLPEEWLRGKVKLGRRSYEVAWLDVDGNGLDLSAKGHDLILLDPKGKKFADLTLDYVTVLRPYVMLMSEPWAVTLEPEMKLSPYEGAVGSFSAEVDLGPALEDAECRALLRGKTGSLSFIMTSPEAGVSVPVGQYANPALVFTSRKDGKDVGTAAFQRRGTINLTSESPCELTVNKPAGLNVTVRQSNRSISVGQTLKSTGNCQLAASGCKAARADGKLARIPAPSVEVFTVGDKPQKLASGSMEYG
jgi:hypothetical protein